MAYNIYSSTRRGGNHARRCPENAEDTVQMRTTAAKMKYDFPKRLTFLSKYLEKRM